MRKWPLHNVVQLSAAVAAVCDGQHGCIPRLHCWQRPSGVLYSRQGALQHAALLSCLMPISQDL